MDPEDIYRAWKRHRAGAELPPGFADKVMGAVRAYEVHQQRRVASWFLALATSRLGRNSILGLALVLFALRLILVVGVFLVSGSGQVE